MFRIDSSASHVLQTVGPNGSNEPGDLIYSMSLSVGSRFVCMIHNDNLKVNVA